MPTFQDGKRAVGGVKRPATRVQLMTSSVNESAIKEIKNNNLSLDSELKVPMALPMISLHIGKKWP